MTSRLEELNRLLGRYLTLEGDEKGQAVRRILDRVVLYWRKLPFRRTQFELLLERTEFHYAAEILREPRETPSP